ncbi:TolC family protein [Rhodoblastus acidophilus]|uniref:TolC family protein n=1 Tax=Candidatus Rhodoblastus alkanivorans TaxID=2954117 RepID=A0ABS9Z635_9HYPH|nr:TolC family protein [Candidatus Rhodoblastus alkanivorans]MCI4679132.1 TolC family protein [Candidatus Rhodoblastus alkanivorans]MCI4683128.1 TolC family protein [Candidatus Rhodoblastus alkanivorans]MDI4640439.1 TolC family protein [Rhodoblastus acidophilus]
MNQYRGMSRPSRRRSGAPPCRRFARLPALLLLAPLAACSVGPKFVAPDAPLGLKWREARNPAVKTRREDYRNWWTAFRDPTLNRLVLIAYDQNLTLMETGARVLKARAILGQAIGEVYPQSQQLNGSGDYIKLPRTDASTNPSNAIGNNFWRVDLGGQVAWEIDLWGKFRHGVESADAAYLASIATYDDVLVTLIGDVANDYIAVRTLQAQIAIAKANVIKQREALDIAQARYKGGATSELDVFQAKNVLAQTEAAIPQYSAQLQKQENALCVLLGEPPQTIDSLLNRSRGIPAPPATVAVGIPADLLRRRPDVRAAELKAVAQGAQVGIAEADLYPAFTLGGAFGTLASTANGATLKPLFTQPSLTFAFGPSFSWPILNYGQITNNVRAQDAELQALLINYKNTVLKAQREVEDGLSGFLQGRHQVVLLKQSVAAASSALTVALAQYQLGTRDFTTVLTAEQNLYQAQNNLVAAEGNVSVSLTMAYRALGGGWQIRWGRDFVTASVANEMRSRTNWGELLPPAGKKAPATPGLPGPSDLGPTVRPPQW